MLSSYRGNALASSPATSNKPISVVGGGGGSSVLLRTNGVINGSQTVLNLANGSNITVTDNGSGTVTIAGTVGSVTLQTDGTPNGSQSLLNLKAGTGIDLADDGVGGITITGSATLALKTDGVANGSQTLLNLVGGTNITLTDNGSGNITIDSSGTGQLPEFTADTGDKILLVAGVSGSGEDGAQLTMDAGDTAGGTADLKGGAVGSNTAGRFVAEGAQNNIGGNASVLAGSGTTTGGSVNIQVGDGTTPGVVFILDENGDAMVRADAGNNRIQVSRPFFPSPDGSTEQTDCAILAGTGAPDNGDGSDGFYYFRADGGLGTHIYFKSSGTWAGII